MEEPSTCNQKAERLAEVSIVYCNSENQIADIMTKALPKTMFEILTRKFGVPKKILIRSAESFCKKLIMSGALMVEEIQCLVYGVVEAQKRTSKSCSTEYVLTEAGCLNDKDDFCKSEGGGEHTKSVLTCIHLVKRDYKFINKATAQDLNFTTTQECEFGFNGTTFFSDGRRTSKSQIASLISILATLFLLMNLDD